MTFWTNSNISPTRQFRFMISNGSGTWWWALSCSKPSYDINTEEYKLINHKYKYPGVLTWNDITITIVDSGDKTFELYNTIQFTGYSPGGEGLTTGDGISKNLSNIYLRNGQDFLIDQIDADGKTIEQWKLVNPFIKSTNFGQLDYSSDELVKLELVISYDYAEFNV